MCFKNDYGISITLFLCGNEQHHDSMDDRKTEHKKKEEQLNNPLHGVKLADILEHLVKVYGWETMGEKINIRCFNSDPSIKSSLTFLRKTPWAREKVERLYLRSLKN